MKYLKIIGSTLYATDEISKRDLVDVKQHSLDAVVDIEKESYFDAEKNEWVKIPQI